MILVREVAQAKTLAPQIADFKDMSRSRRDLRSDRRIRRQSPEGHAEALLTELG
jgi:hypothetical protein